MYFKKEIWWRIFCSNSI